MFKKLSDQQLDEVQDILSQTGLKAEERLMMLSSAINTAVGKLSGSQAVISKAILNIHSSFANLYVPRFGVAKGGAMILSHSKFEEMLTSHKKVRKTMLKMSRDEEKSSSSAARAADDVVEEDASKKRSWFF